MDISQLTTFFAWMTMINFALLAFSSIIVIAFRSMIYRLHAKFFGMDEQQVASCLYQIIGQYKIAIILLNLVPWLALKALGS